MTGEAPPRLAAFIDTGGTFTDVLVRRPDGGLRRAKVLSSSALRGRLVSVDGSMLRLRARWAVPEGFLTAARVTVLGVETPHGAAPARVHSSTASRTVGSQQQEHEMDVRVDETLAAHLEGLPAAAIEFGFDDEAPILGVRLALGIAPGAPLPSLEMRLATTRATNALLERRGARVALFVTRGLADLLEIGDQTRPDLFAREVKKRAPLYEGVIEVDERRAADGAVVRPLDVEGHGPAALAALAGGFDVAAVALLHADRWPDTERLVEADLRRRGFRRVVLSSSLSRQQRLVPRAETTVVEAFLVPAFADYVRRIAEAMAPGSTLLLMTSAGGLIPAADFRAIDGLISGPAGGLVGVAAAARSCGEGRILGFDMGGTSTDATRFAGEFVYRFETRVGDATILSPCLAVETVAAGGGSVCRFDGDRLTVGPDSAGASPGPACYGAGGPLTITDVNLLLGRLWPPGFELPIDARAARARLAEILRRVAGGHAEVLLSGFLRIANERMADAVRAVSLRDGEDPADFTLAAFGGAGGQHACEVAEELGIRRVLVPADTGLLSAVGLAHARVERFAEERLGREMGSSGAQVDRQIAAAVERLTSQAEAALGRDGFAGSGQRVTRRILSLRVTGQEVALSVDWVPGLDLRRSFIDSFRRIYGYEPRADARLELDTLRVFVAVEPPPWREPGPAADGSGTAKGDRGAAPADDPRRHTKAWIDGSWRRVPVVDRDALATGGDGRAALPGPALIVERWSTVWLPPGWRADGNAAGGLILRQEKAGA